MMNAKCTYRGLLEWQTDVLYKFTPPKKAIKILEKLSKSTFRSSEELTTH